MKIFPKLLVSLVLPGILAALAMIVYSGKITHDVLISEIEQIGIQKSSDLAGALSLGLIRSSELLLLPGLEACQRSTGALYVAALDMQGRVVAHTNVGEVGRRVDGPFWSQSLASPEPRWRELKADGRPVLDLAVPIYEASRAASGEDFLLSSSEREGRRVGTLRLGLPLGEAAVTEARIARGLSWVVLLFGGLASALFLLVVRRVLAPVRLLAVGTERIRAGDYGAVVPETSTDELGTLARSFNAMSQALASTTVSKDFFNDILLSIQDQLIVTDPGGMIRLVNPSLLGLLGYAREELVGRPASLLFDARVELLSGEGLERVKKEGAVRNVSTCFLRKSGEKTPILLSVSALKGKDGRVEGFIGAAKDVSDLKKLEARMQQSEKLSAVGQLAAGVAHEINNPLGVILGFAQGMSRALKPSDPLELPIKSIEREALRCKTLVQDLLTFARTAQSDREALDLNPAVEQAVALAAAQAKMTQVKVEVDLAPGLPMVLANKNQVQQIVLNLAKNAIDAMPNGGTLSIRTELRPATPHSWVCLKVADTGTGIPPALMGKIFEPFFTTKPVGQGTGLGLSLINEIVRKHSGDIEIDSKPGATVFTVKFPARTGQELAERREALEQEKLASAQSGYRKGSGA